MFRKLHLRLTCLCSLITICILVLFAGLYLYVAEKTLSENHFLSFQHDMDTLCSGLEQQTVITYEYLQKLENSGNYSLLLWDGGVPFQFNSLEQHDNVRNFAGRLWEDAVSSGLFPQDIPYSFHTETVREEDGTEYDVGLAHITSGRNKGSGRRMDSDPYSAADSSASDNGSASDGGSAYNDSSASGGGPEAGGLTLALLSPRTGFLRQLNIQRMWFILLSAGACVLLTFFAWLFTARLLHPIRENQQRQLQFLSDASHELRTPLAVIRSCNNVQPPHCRDIIEKECAHMGRLLEDMLTLTGLETGRRTLKKESVEPDTFLLNLYEQMEPLAAEKHLHIAAELPEQGLKKFPADPVKLRQVMMILLQNAIAYTPEGGRIVLRAFSCRRGVCFQVEDTGPGIPDKDKDRVFERFFRAESSRTIKGHFGLGLCIAREIMQAHQGRISAGSAPGGGAVFTCFFPGREGG